MLKQTINDINNCLTEISLENVSKRELREAFVKGVSTDNIILLIDVLDDLLMKKDKQ